LNERSLVTQRSLYQQAQQAFLEGKTDTQTLAMLSTIVATARKREKPVPEEQELVKKAEAYSAAIRELRTYAGPMPADAVSNDVMKKYRYGEHLAIEGRQQEARDMYREIARTIGPAAPLARGMKKHFAGRANPLLVEFLAEPSVMLAKKLVAGNEGMDPVVAQRSFGDLFAILEEQIREGTSRIGLVPEDEDLDVQFITLPSKELIEDQIPCFIATLAIEKNTDQPAGKIINTVVFAGLQEFWDSLKNNGPPLGYALEDLLRLLVQHKIGEYIALRPELIAQQPRLRESLPWLSEFEPARAGPASPELDRPSR
jgi:hypothetical protein